MQNAEKYIEKILISDIFLLPENECENFGNRAEKFDGNYLVRLDRTEKRARQRRIFD